ncbi:hypothetical protein D6T64_16685 [Cryobacterium melibiosiphilum]|uniref:DUF308 domain-containing protein n=1 Tax=Cryobacterium melibiosiphilum TaxID=995039 RepID=A0A3A5MGH1_9MICO|nr:DUF308 domain-containing protein [Cryobacterium melibiosiphilum]RJT87069.1 hypothetical protein D6T64_16685 [Cryobacterium melibiosiphilum]
MANSQPASAALPRYWTVPIGRAVVALVATAVITFNRDHSAAFGLLVFGGYALISGLLLIVASWRTLADARDRQLFVVQGFVGVLAGALALGFAGGGLGFFLYLVSVWGAVTGFLELYSGLRRRRAAPVGVSTRDWMSMGGLTAVLALAFLLLPPNTVVAVGLLGAYLAVFGIFLVIGGLSLKWAATDAPRPVAPVANESDSQ